MRTIARRIGSGGAERVDAKERKVIGDSGVPGVSPYRSSSDKVLTNMTVLPRNIELRFLGPLPAEILSQIFDYYIANVDNARDKHKPSQYDLPFPSIRQGQLTLVRVSRPWRQLACSTTSIWTTFAVDFQDHVTSKSLLEMAEFWLVQSGTRPLHISLYNSSLFEPITPKPFADIFNFFCQEKHMKRWKTLQLCFPSWLPGGGWSGSQADNQWRDKLDFLVSLRTKTPLLQKVIVDFATYAEPHSTGGSLAPLIMSSPALTHMTWLYDLKPFVSQCGTSGGYSPLQKLVFLELGNNQSQNSMQRCIDADVRRVLHCTPVLKTLTVALANQNHAPDPDEAVAPPLTLLHLHTLIITHDGRFGNFIDSLTLPMLTTLLIRTNTSLDTNDVDWPYGTPQERNVATLLRRSGCSLTTLKLELPNDDKEDADHGTSDSQPLDLLGLSLPPSREHLYNSLITLDLSSPLLVCTVFPGLLRAFSQNVSIGAPILPRLRTLQLSIDLGVQSDLFEQFLSALVLSMQRHGANEAETVGSFASLKELRFLLFADALGDLGVETRGPSQAVVKYFAQLGEAGVEVSYAYESQIIHADAELL